MAAEEEQVVDHEARLAAYNELFSNRYSDTDEEYVKNAKRDVISPPCISDWISLGYGGRDRRGGGGQHDDHRHGGRDRDDRYRRNSGDGRYNPRERHGRDYRDKDHRDSRDNRDRYGRRHDSHENRRTEYGTQNFYHFYY